MTSKEGLKLLETRCRFFAQDEDELQETYEARETIKKDLEILEIIKKHKLLNYVLKNEKCANMYHLSKEEIDLLREIEKWLEMNI